MSTPEQASFTWRLRQQGKWLLYAGTMPASSASRVACAVLREFAGRRFTPPDIDVTGETPRFTYRSDAMTLALRRLNK